MSNKNSKTSNQNDGGGSIGYLTKEGFRSIKSNKLMSLASVAVLTSCLIMIGCSILIFLNIDNILHNIESQNVVMVFIKDEIDQNAIDKVGQDLRATPNVKECEYVPKAESYKKQLKSMGKDAELLEGLNNPLPNAYKVTLKDMDEFTTSVKYIKEVKNITSVRENSTLAQQLAKIRRTVTYVSTGIIIMLLVVSLFIISNTIRVTMYNRKLEISIMKAVGATNAFIRWPFLVEGMVIGLISSLLSLLLTFGVYELALSSIKTVMSVIGGVAIGFGSYAWQLLLGYIFIGAIAGTAGSCVSMNRYLKENKGAV